MQPELVLTELDNGKALDVPVGTSVMVRLAENPATGYRWTLDQVDEALLGVEGSEFERTPGSGVGGGGTRTFRLVARAPGRAHVTLNNKRAWERDASAVGQFQVTLNILR